MIVALQVLEAVLLLLGNYLVLRVVFEADRAAVMPGRRAR